jgi:hypothetical protein
MIYEFDMIANYFDPDGADYQPNLETVLAPLPLEKIDINTLIDVNDLGVNLQLEEPIYDYVDL